MIRLSPICFFLSVCAFGALHVETKEMVKLKDDLALKRSQVVKLAASIRSIEDKIGKLNSSYLERVKQAQLLESKISHLAQGLDAHKKVISEEQEKLNSLLKRYVLEVQDDDDDLSLLKKEVIKESAKKRQEKLNYVKNKYGELATIYEEYKQRLGNAQIAEKELYSLIVELENQKKDMSQRYVQTSGAQDQIERKYTTLKAKRRAYARSLDTSSLTPIRFISPLEGPLSSKESEKGIKYAYKSKMPVRAGASGEIVYTGELAAYGKVIIVDHGHEIRSVVLGDMSIKVKKGDRVKEGQLLAYTRTQNGVKKELYYEIRRKNIAQKTTEWMKTPEQLANI